MPSSYNEWGAVMRTRRSPSFGGKVYQKIKKVMMVLMTYIAARSAEVYSHDTPICPARRTRESVD